MRRALNFLCLAVKNPKSLPLIWKLFTRKPIVEKDTVVVTQLDENGNPKEIPLGKNAYRLTLKEICQRKIQQLNAVPLEIQEPKILEKILSQKTRLCEIQKRL